MDDGKSEIEVESDAESELLQPAPAKETSESASDSDSTATTLCVDEAGAANFYGAGLADFLERSRKEEKDRGVALEDFVINVERRVDNLKRLRNVVTDTTNMTFDQRFKRLLTVLNVGEKTDNYAMESKRQRKTSIAVKLLASVIFREKYAKALEKRIASYNARVMDKKKAHLDFLGRELIRRERRWQKARQADRSWREDLAALEQKRDPDARRLELLRDIQAAHDKLDRYTKTKGKDGEKSIGSRKRPPPIEAPKRGESCKVAKTTVFNSRKKSDEEISAMAAKSIARFTMDWQEAMLGRQTVLRGETNFEGDVVSNPEYVHEDQLLKALWPNGLKSKPWKIHATPMGELDHRHDAIFQAIVNVQRVQHVHSLALASLFNNVSDVRMAVAKDGDNKEQFAKEIAAAKEATLLASDPDLRNLPFRSISSIADYFIAEDRVEKLALYLCTYVAYDRLHFAKKLNSALLHPQLMDLVNWVGPRKRG